MKLKEKLNSYQQQAITTKIYADEVALPYVVLGVIGEIGEFMEVLSLSVTDKDRLEKEGGDVMWYLAAVCTEVGKDMGDVLHLNDTVQINLGADVTTLAEVSKKYLRDEWPNEISADKWNKTSTVLNRIFNLVVRTLVSADIILYDVLDKNVAKLQSRKDRGVLSGSGDNR